MAGVRTTGALPAGGSGTLVGGADIAVEYWPKAGCAFNATDGCWHPL